MTDAGKNAPQSMRRRYRSAMMWVNVLCVALTFLLCTVLYRQIYARRVDSYLQSIGCAVTAGFDGDAAALPARLPQNQPLRFTLIAQDGTVLYDTVSQQLSNHADRPEFKDALQNGTGTATRTSATLGRESRYFALRLDTPNGVQVLRVGQDVANIWGISINSLPLICLALLLILAGAAAISRALTLRLV